MLREKYRLDEEKQNRLMSKPTEAEDITGKSGSVPPGMVEAGSMDMLKLMDEAMNMNDDEESEDDALPTNREDV